MAHISHLESLMPLRLLRRISLRSMQLWVELGYRLNQRANNQLNSLGSLIPTKAFLQSQLNELYRSRNACLLWYVKKSDTIPRDF